MAVLETILLGMAANAAYGFTTATARKAYDVIRTSRPDTIAKVEAASAAGDESALRDAIAGALEIAAATGQVSIDGAMLKAVRGARFDHQRGQIFIGNTTVEAAQITTGGRAGSTGRTDIGGGTVLRTKGTSIEVGHGASITMTGNASIKQT